MFGFGRWREVDQKKFRDRRQAGRVLADHLQQYAGRPDVLILALPRGGVPVAYEVARVLHAPLDLFMVRKVGVPGQEELAMGAVAAGGLVVLNPQVVDGLAMSQESLSEAIQRESQEVERRSSTYRGQSPDPKIQGKVVILIDDGLATGATMRAAVQALRHRNPQRIVVAVPVGPSETCVAFQAEADEVICAETPEPFQAVGLWYDDFQQTSDEEVRRLLEEAHSEETRQESRAVL